MGGDPAGKIDYDQHDFALWEKRVDALLVLSSSAGLMNTDSLRRVLEDMGEEAYEEMSYYERWISSICQNMIEVGAFSTEELAKKMEIIKSRGATYGDASWKCRYVDNGLQVTSEHQVTYEAKLALLSEASAPSIIQNKTLIV